jgi:hypothetical protein
VRARPEDDIEFASMSALSNIYPGQVTPGDLSTWLDPWGLREGSGEVDGF